MSIRLNLIELAIKLLGPKSFLEKNKNEFDKIINRFEKDQKNKLDTKILKNKFLKIDYIENRAIYRVKRDDKKKDKVIFFLFGGGFVASPTNINFRYINLLLESIDCEIIMPDYPLFPKNKLSQIVQFTYKAYLKILEEYNEVQVIFLGFSSGASLSLYLLNYINMKNLEPQYPKLMILSSPVGELPLTKDISNKMKELNEKDIILSYSFISELGKRLVETEFPKLTSTIEHNLTGFPPIKLFYGENEIFYSYLSSFKRVQNKYNLDIEYIIGEKMSHCWPLLINTPEGRKSTEKIIDIIKEN